VLTNKLRIKGIDIVIDQYIEAPPEGWNYGMDREIITADFILMVCTIIYFKRVIGQLEIFDGLKLPYYETAIKDLDRISKRLKK